MRFLFLVAILALFSFAVMQENEVLNRYFHKKMCYCVHANDGLCEKLKCCDVYKHVPYKIVIRMCRYGNCEFVSSATSEHLEEEVIVRREERDATLAI